jgi:hypothetical protein
VNTSLYLENERLAKRQQIVCEGLGQSEGKFVTAAGWNRDAGRGGGGFFSRDAIVDLCLHECVLVGELGGDRSDGVFMVVLLSRLLCKSW